MLDEVKQNKKRVIDLRSDTFTEPSAEMRKVMANAAVGDDVWGTDPTVLELESHVANLLGKEAALYVPSGTMSNLIATTVHCSGLFNEVIMGHDAHTSIYEVGNTVLARCHSRQVVSAPDGTLPIEALRKNIQVADIHNPITRAIFLENTQNSRGGKVLPMSYLNEVRALADQHKIKLHCDGARIWNAATALKLPVSDLAKPFDTLSVCCSKGLGAPIGSLLVGPKDFIAQALHCRKMYGGGMRQVGIIASGALYAVKHMYDRIEEDHEMTRQLGEGLDKLGFSVIPPETNILLFDALTEKRDEFVKQCEDESVLLCPMGPDGLVRAMPHYGNTFEDVKTTLSVIERVREKLKY